jgi:hypothetical protein
VADIVSVNDAVIENLNVAGNATVDGNLTKTGVAGYYTLSTDVYPALNPASFAVQSVSTWTQRSIVSTPPGSQNLRSICWSPQLKLFVAVGGTGNANQDRIITSPDGITWTTSASTYFAMRSVCWSPELGLFVVVGINGAANTNIAPFNTSTNSVITSPDGITWTIRTSAGPVGSELFWLGVCWSPELGIFVAVAYTDFAGLTTNRVMTSSDGINWNLRTSPTATWYAVCWSPETRLFVAVSEGGSASIMTSSDGINWTTRTSPVTNSWGSVCWSAELGIFVAVGRSGTTTTNLITSPDGINWTSRTSANNNQWLGVCWSAELGVFVAVASTGAGNRIMTSPNGINWTSRTNSSALNSVCWSPELGIFVASSDVTGLFTSSLTGRPPTSYNVFNTTLLNTTEQGLTVVQQLGRYAPVTKTGNFTVAVGENWIIVNSAGAVTVTLPTAASWVGREIMFKTVGAGAVNSASSNVVPRNSPGPAGGTAILAAGAGNWATLVSDGTNWIIMQGS